MNKQYRIDIISSQDWFKILILIVLCLVLYFPNLNGIDLWGSDEPRYAEVAREMVADNHWVVPHFNGEVYFDKPPLFFWFIGLISLITGEVTEFTARLPAALMGLGTVLVVFFLGKRLINQRVGFFAALMLATAPQIHKYARMARLDLPFTFLITLALASFFYGRMSARHNKWYFIAFWVFMGLATLLKGPLGFFIPLCVIFFYLLFNKELRFFKQIQPLTGALIFFFVVFAWFIPAQLIGGSEYTESGTIKHGFQYLINPWDHSAPFYYYFPELLVGAAPWSLFLPSAVILCLSNKYKEEKKRLLGPVLWFLVIFIIFTLGLSKRASYILPLYPAVAILVAILWDKFLDQITLQRSKLTTIPCYALMICIILGAVAIPILAHNKYSSLFGYSFIISFCLLAFVTFFYIFYSKGKFKFLLASIILVAAVPELITDHVVLPKKNRYETEKPVCDKIASFVGINGKWAVYRSFRNAYPFYIKNYPKRLKDKDDLYAFLSSGQKVYCLIPKDDYNELQKEEKIFALSVCNINSNDKELLLISNK